MSDIPARWRRRTHTSLGRRRPRGDRGLQSRVRASGGGHDPRGLPLWSAGAKTVRDRPCEVEGSPLRGRDDLAGLGREVDLQSYRGANRHAAHCSYRSSPSCLAPCSSSPTDTACGRTCNKARRHPSEASLTLSRGGACKRPPEPAPAEASASRHRASRGGSLRCRCHPAAPASTAAATGSVSSAARPRARG